ncbi:succinate dehydrogenase, hydrophobic membrane anchor protein [Burkholderia ambifaria]|uniref:succinate dehydrogenase, hydrophobic membrane anchor protein n=1 Tax=Burkholderia TaxID=32008 RepID=UPI000CFFAE9F|nr:succinate dehydrogenase, hydrophobic membrane anchor protein [Burkholderia ambifaria]ELK6209140.1 succinate dehydrogenase, hydrophobic membrane anchor protein [Burkholderia ambifaria]MBR8184245.1 succinate dehydrogenase, hydrophobic membrane anchor protein [Burkholderia ambifaria]MBR8221199.1 succinate dehydrogenase, hydrophobic membrane anchor protein [Burkholderia ambifaria]MBR8342963.1 succinate dehydrogenase, hydrophobic membrane anchor protein [Burkholderia ambifaria]PRG07252.1 succina
MAANNRIGSKRLVVGAHYGLRDWLAQRVTATIMAVYTVILLALFFAAHDFSYEGWASIFSAQWMKLATFVTLLSLFYHAWVGVRDIWMDYVKPVGVRLLLQSLTIVWLLACAGYAAQILWRV